MADQGWTWREHYDQRGGAMKPRRPRRRNHVWIIEASYARGRWHPTVGIALTFQAARVVRRDWQRRNPHDSFHIVEYRSTR